MPSTTQQAKPAGAQAACVTTLASKPTGGTPMPFSLIGPLSPRSTESPADDATREVPSQRLYYTTMIQFLSGFSPD